MESKKITAEDVRKAIIKRQNEYISSLIEKNLGIDISSGGVICAIDMGEWENINGIGVKILEEVVQNIYEKFGVYIGKAEYYYCILLYPNDMDTLKKYPIKNTEVRSIFKKRIRDNIFKNEVIYLNEKPFNMQFAKKILEVEEIISKDEWLEFQKSVIDKNIDLMLSRGIADQIVELNFFIFSEEVIEYAKERGFTVDKITETGDQIRLVVPNTHD